MTNTAKYAQATKVGVSVLYTEEAVHATVSDNGKGFDAQTLLKLPWQERGLGLAGMHERAALLDGALLINTEPGRGTTIDVAIPLTRRVGNEARANAEKSRSMLEASFLNTTYPVEAEVPPQGNPA